MFLGDPRKFDNVKFPPRITRQKKKKMRQNYFAPGILFKKFLHKIKIYAGSSFTASSKTNIK